MAQILAGRVTVTGVATSGLFGTVNSLMRIVAATYSAFQGSDDDFYATHHSCSKANGIFAAEIYCSVVARFETVESLSFSLLLKSRLDLYLSPRRHFY